MKNLLKLLSFIAVLCVATSLNAETLSGNCGAEGTDGDNLQYTFNTGTGVLVITGSGAMKDYAATEAPWYGNSCTSVQLPEGLTSIGNYAFYSCAASSQALVLPSTVERIGKGAFNDSQFSSITLPEGLTTIETWALASMRVSSISIPSTVTTIGENAFIYTGFYITSYVVDERNTVYDSRNGCNAIIETATNKLLFGCSTTVIPSSVTTIVENAFYGTHIESIVIPEGVTTLESTCFRSCSYLHSVSIPASVTTLGDRCFGSMGTHAAANVSKDVYVHWDTPLALNSNINYNPFSQVMAAFTLHVPCGATPLYQAADVWKDFGEIVEDDRHVLTLAVNDPALGTATIIDRTCNDITIKAERIGHARFRYWSDGDTNAERMVSLVGDSTITAIFEKLELTCEDVHTELTDSAFNSYTWNGQTYTESGDYQQIFIMESECDSIVTLHLSILKGGYCGASPNEESLQWRLNTRTGVLTITGSGDMKDYASNHPAPWDDYRDSITCVSLPEGLNSIGMMTFNNCPKLTSIVLPQSLQEIHGYSFQYSGLTSIVLPDNLREVGNQAFYRTKIRNITFPSGSCNLGYNAFALIPIRELILPLTVTNTAGSAFASCDSLTLLSLPEGLEELPTYMFSGCASLETVTLPSTLKKIHEGVFNNCWKLKVPAFPEGLELIGQYAFFQCWGAVSSISIPSTVDSIGYKTFYNCSSEIEDIFVYAQTPITKIDVSAFERLYNSTLHVPCGTKELYQAAPVWNQFNAFVTPDGNYNLTLLVNDDTKGKIVVLDSVCSTYTIKAQRIGHNIFTHWSDGVTEAERTITLTKDSTLTAYFEAVQLDCDDVHDSISVEAVGSYTWNERTYTASGDYEQAFLLPSGCDSIVIMHLVIMPGGNCGAEGTDGDNLKWAFNPETGKLYITGAGKMANYQMYSENYAPWYEYRQQITDISMPSGMTTIGERAFFNLEEITEAVVPSSVTDIGKQAFEGCEKLQHITLPSGLTTLDAWVFNGCKALKLTVPDGITAVGQGAVSGCFAIEELILPSTLTYIGEYAFNSNRFTVVKIPASVDYISERAFRYCTEMTDFYVQWTTPLAVPSNTFESVNLSAITLHVPCGSKSAYEVADVWSDFGTIVDDLAPYIVTLRTNNAEWGKAEIIEQTCTTVTILATRLGRGTRFVQWSDGITDAERTLVVTHDSTLTAIFERVDCEDKTGEFSAEAIINYTWNGQTYTESGDYQQTIETVLGCDSLVTLHLTINPGGYCGNEGYNGENLQWMYRPTAHELIITGERGMRNYNEVSFRPWHEYRGDITSVSLPEGLTFVGQNAFRGFTKLTEIVIPESVVKVATGALAECTLLTEAKLPTNLTKISHSLFYGCSSLANIEIPANVDTIDMNAFTSCTSLEQIELPNTLRLINHAAFEYTGIKSLTIPQTVDSIGQYAFYTSSIEDLYVQWDSPYAVKLNKDVFDLEWNPETYTNFVDATLHVPCGTKELYENAEQWKLFRSIEEPPADQTEFSVTADDCYPWNDVTYTESGDYEQTFKNVIGCDSVVTLHLTIIPLQEPSGELKWRADDEDISELGEISADTTIRGLTFVATNSKTVEVDVSKKECGNIKFESRIKLNGSMTQDARHLKFDVVGDATIEVYAISANKNGVRTLNIAAGTWNNNIKQFNVRGDQLRCYVYNYTGDATTLFIGSAASGINIYGINVIDRRPPKTLEFSDEGCDSYIWNGQTYTTSGNYEQTLSASDGRDSIVTLHLTIFDSVTDEFSKTEEGSYTWNGITYTESGTYTQTLATTHGCDSVVTLHLTITNTPQVVLTVDQLLEQDEVKNLNADETTTSSFKVRGYVTKIQYNWSEDNHNMSFWIDDVDCGAQDKFEIYKATGTAAAHIGDFVECVGQVSYYRGTTYEMPQGATYTIITPAASAQEMGETTIADFIAAADCRNIYTLTGTVSNITNTQYGNFDLTDNTGTIYIYGLLTPEGQSKQFETLDVTEGDTLTLKGVYKLYENSPQINNAVFVSRTKPTQHEGIEPVTGNPSPVTHKILRDGQIYIIRNGKTYDMVGKQIK